MVMVTVEEAAHRLGISVATVRRRLASGRLAGTKVGRDWHVDGESLPVAGVGTGSSAALSAFSDPEIKAAIQHVSGVDLTELWVPDILRWADVLRDQDELVARAQRRVAEGTFASASEVRIPKASLASRSGTMPDLVDRIVYQAATARLAPGVEAATSARVFSARTTAGSQHFLERSVSQYVKWRKAYLAQLKSRAGLLVTTDLSSYFDTIDQPTLLKELDELTHETFAVETIRKQLRAWTVLMHRGIPQGPNASRLIGNAYLLPVDDLMIGAGYDYWRYMDDVAIVVADHAEAARAMADFERACHRRGLLVSSAKTRVLSETEAFAESGNAAKDAIEYLIRAGSSRARGGLMKIFNKAVPSEGRIDESDAKFSVWRLARELDRGPLKRMLARLQDLGPIASVSAAYLRHFLTHSRATDAIGKFLSDPERNTSNYLESWLFAAILEHPGKPPDEWLRRVRVVAADRNAANFHRVLALNVLALGGKANDLARLKRVTVDEHDPEVVRGALVALARVSKLDRGTSDTTALRHPELQSVVTYLAGRGDLPSLIYRGRVVAVRRL